MQEKLQENTELIAPKKSTASRKRQDAPNKESKHKELKQIEESLNDLHDKLVLYATSLLLSMVLAGRRLLDAKRLQNHGEYPRMTQIASAVIPFAVATTMQAPPNQELLVTKHLTLGELPPGCSEEVRDDLALTEEAAVTGSEMVRHTTRVRPNHATTSVYGNVTLRETDFFNGLSLRQQVLPQIADKLRSQLSEARAKVTVDTSASIRQLNANFARRARADRLFILLPTAVRAYANDR